jgi:hypothetical protein
LLTSRVRKQRAEDAELKNDKLEELPPEGRSNDADEGETLLEDGHDGKLHAFAE